MLTFMTIWSRSRLVKSMNRPTAVFKRRCIADEEFVILDSRSLSPEQTTVFELKARQNYLLNQFPAYKCSVTERVQQ